MDEGRFPSGRLGSIFLQDAFWDICLTSMLEADWFGVCRSAKMSCKLP